MLCFSATAEGKYFNGRSLGTGVDTQRGKIGGSLSLSARYMLEGKDIDGLPCRIFIENNGSFEGGFEPRIITDSAALSEFEDRPLKAKIKQADGGVVVSIYAFRG